MRKLRHCFDDLGKHWDGLDGIVHSIAFAPREALSGDYLESVNREAFRIAHDVSSYSFAALAKAGLPLMEGRKGSLLTLTYLGSTRVMPSYNVMGLAKASLEANVRFMAPALALRAYESTPFPPDRSKRWRPRESAALGNCSVILKR